MQTSNEYLYFLLKASWQSAVLIVLVLAVQWAFGRRLNPRWRYGLWLLVMIRLALPWTAPSSLSLFNVFNRPAPAFSGGIHSSGQGSVQPTSVNATTQPAKGSTLAPVNASSQRSLGLSWLVALWAIGGSTLAFYLLAVHHRLSKRVAAYRSLTNAPVMTLLQECKHQMGVRVPITLVETTKVGSPALFGFIRPRLLLPAGLTQSFSLDEMRYVFLHELSHIKRHDILIGWLMTGLQILHWFNPLVWVAVHRMRVDRELACDALALSYAREDENQPYGRTIIKLLESFGRSAWSPSLAGTVENKNQMKERISMIARFKKSNRGGFLPAALLFAILGLATLTDAQSGKSENPRLSKDLIGTWVFVGAVGEAGETPASGGRHKEITDGQWSLTETDPKTGVTNFHHGGIWSLKGNEYAETVQYANASTAELLKRTFKFTAKVEGDTLTLIGNGNPWREVWKRANSDSTKPTTSASQILQGKWLGNEVAPVAQYKKSMEEQVKLRMIVLNKPASGDIAHVQKQAEEILTRIKSGTAFSELASSFSEDNRRAVGGDWGWIDPSVMRKELAEAASSLKPGEVSGIIETPETLSLILVEDRRRVPSKATGSASLVVKGSNLEFHGEDPREWYRGTFTTYNTTPKQLVVSITDCPMPDYVGKTAFAIFHFQDGTLTITGNEPGNPVMPANFEMPGSRKLVFKRE
jgi:beta-lactamase regulating signal transducer with metallopeptidase domain